VNEQNLNSCESAQALVGAVWSKNDRASSAICAAIGTSQGIFSDYAAAKHGCGSGGNRNSTLASATGPMADQVPVNVNYAWKAIQASPLLSADRQLAEFAMALTGTVIVKAPESDSVSSGPIVRVIPPHALQPDLLRVLMEGNGTFKVYRCVVADKCLDLVEANIPIPEDEGFRWKVMELLNGLVRAVRLDRRPRPEELALVNLTSLPVYRVANAAAAYRGVVIDSELETLAESVALDLMMVWIADLHRLVEERAGTLDIADGEQLRLWRERLRHNRVALADRKDDGLKRLDRTLAIVEKLRLIEMELAGVLSSDLRDALGFARGGAGGGSR